LAWIDGLMESKDSATLAQELCTNKILCSTYC
jgi:hypothetical protein